MIAQKNPNMAFVDPDLGIFIFSGNFAIKENGCC